MSSRRVCGGQERQLCSSSLQKEAVTSTPLEKLLINLNFGIIKKISGLKHLALRLGAVRTTRLFLGTCRAHCRARVQSPRRLDKSPQQPPLWPPAHPRTRRSPTSGPSPCPTRTSRFLLPRVRKEATYLPAPPSALLPRPVPARPPPRQRPDLPPPALSSLPLPQRMLLLPPLLRGGRLLSVSALALSTNLRVPPRTLPPRPPAASWSRPGATAPTRGLVPHHVPPLPREGQNLPEQWCDRSSQGSGLGPSASLSLISFI